MQLLTTALLAITSHDPAITSLSALIFICGIGVSCLVSAGRTPMRDFKISRWLFRELPGRRLLCHNTCSSHAKTQRDNPNFGFVIPRFSFAGYYLRNKPRNMFLECLLFSRLVFQVCAVSDLQDLTGRKKSPLAK